MSDEMNEPRLGPARLLAQAFAAAVLLVMVGVLFYVSPLGPGGASGRATPTPHPGVVFERYAVAASDQTGDLLPSGTRLEIDLGNDGVLSAYGPCSHIGGDYSISAGVLEVSTASMAAVGCNQGLTDQDQRVLDLLQAKPSISLTDSTLVLKTTDITLTLTRMPAAYAPTPLANPPLSISNGTTLHVTLVVNGVPVGTFPPGAYADPIKNLQLPDLPWSVEARTDSGRLLASFSVKVGQVWATAYPGGHSEASGAGARADLSCGRLDVWSGPPMMGPAPPPSFPAHDCDP